MPYDTDRLGYRKPRKVSMVASPIMAENPITRLGDSQLQPSTAGSLTPAPAVSNCCPFLGLARELRDMIYEHLLVFEKENETTILPCKISPHRIIPNKRRMLMTPSGYMSYAVHPDSEVLRHSVLSIMQASRRIYDEAAATFYTKNHFIFHTLPAEETSSVPTCHAFLKDRSKYALEYIKSIEFDVNFRCGDGHLDSHAKQYGAEVDTLVTFVNKNLPALEHITVNLSGLLPDVCAARWTWVEFQRSSLYQKAALYFCLLELRNVKSLGIRYRFLDDICYGDLITKEILPCMVSCVGFLRAHILLNGQTLGVKNIRIHHRHCASFTFGTWKREFERVYVVECHDDQHGESLLQPASRLSPLREGLAARARRNAILLRTQIEAHLHRNAYPLRGHNYPAFQIHSVDPNWETDRDVLDWDVNDNADNDSLNELDISSADTRYITDD